MYITLVDHFVAVKTADMLLYDSEVILNPMTKKPYPDQY